jgi:hypothetical protein
VIPEDRLQQIIKNKDAAEAQRWCNKHGYTESWSIIDGAMVIYDHDNPPLWLAPILALQDDDGNTAESGLAGVTPMRKPHDGEYADPQPELVPMDAEATAA